MQPIRRLHWAGALAVLLLAVAAVALWQLLDERRVRGQLEARLTALVGRPVSVRGPIEYTLVPALTFDVRGIEVAGGRTAIAARRCCRSVASRAACAPARS